MALRGRGRPLSTTQHLVKGCLSPARLVDAHQVNGRLSHPHRRPALWTLTPTAPVNRWASMCRPWMMRGGLPHACATVTHPSRDGLDDLSYLHGLFDLSSRTDKGGPSGCASVALGDVLLTAALFSCQSYVFSSTCFDSTLTPDQTLYPPRNLFPKLVRFRH